MTLSDNKRMKKQLKELKNEFVEENSCTELKAPSASDCCGQILTDFDAQTHEAWVLQCPKGMDPDVLHSKRIKLPGRRYIGDLQVRATPYEQPIKTAIGFVNSKGKKSLVALHLSGYMTVSERLNIQQPNENTTNTEFPIAEEPTQFKLPIRHPFFGRNYKNCVEIPKNIAKALRKADKRNAQLSAELQTTSNYYTLRRQLAQDTQTLQQKEHEVRQSVLTGVKPKFLNEIVLSD